MKRMAATLMTTMLACALASLNTAGAQEPNKPEASGWKTTVFALNDATRIGEYWVGMEVTQPSDDDRKKLELPADRGIVVQQVVPDSPAAKAGLKVGDALLKAGDKPLKELSDALEAIREAKDGDLTFEYLRDGKTDKVTIKPTKRPSGFGFEEAVNPPAITGFTVPLSAAKVAEQKELAKARERQSGMAAQAQGMMGGAPDLRKIRRELHEIQERIGEIDRQLAQLEASRAIPNRERLTRQMVALKRAIAELTDAGRIEDAERLKRELRELSEQLELSGERGADSSIHGTLNLIGPGIAIMEGPGKPAAQPGVLPSPAEPGQALAYRLAMPQQSDATVAELRKQVEQLRRELSELRDQAAKEKK